MPVRKIFLDFRKNTPEDIPEEISKIIFCKIFIGTLGKLQRKKPRRIPEEIRREIFKGISEKSFKEFQIPGTSRKFHQESLKNKSEGIPDGL